MSQGNIFAADISFQPLAHRLRPARPEDLVGIKDLACGQALINWLRNPHKKSALLWGPPGTGKTTIAKMAANLGGKDFRSLHAFDAGVKDLRAVIEDARKLPGTIVLFVDEIHNFNKNQQDILLDAIETGLMTFIGATTENPAVSINKALASRLIKFELRAHSYTDHEILIERACRETSKQIDNDAKDYLIKASYGDARTLLTFFEQATEQARDQSEARISLALVQALNDGKHFSGDPNTYYDCVSALQKSMRGSDPDASLYWLARLLNSGAELKMICRRIVVTAAEDVGLADPQAFILAQAAYDAALNLGMPEARIPLAEAVSYIALAPKSNAAYKALDKALADCRSHPPYPVPYHLIGLKDSCPANNMNIKYENPVTSYKYPHDYPGNWIEQDYMPKELKHKQYLDHSASEQERETDNRDAK